MGICWSWSLVSTPHLPFGWGGIYRAPLLIVCCRDGISFSFILICFTFIKETLNFFLSETATLFFSSLCKYFLFHLFFTFTISMNIFTCLKNTMSKQISKIWFHKVLLFPMFASLAIYVYLHCKINYKYLDASFLNTSSMHLPCKKIYFTIILYHS